MASIKKLPALTLDQTWDAVFTVSKTDFSAQAKTLLDEGENYTIQFGDISLAVSTWGAGPTVLLVHGWSGHRAQLRAFVKPLVSSGFRIVSFDAPAHGDTPGSMTNLFQYRDALLTVAAHESPNYAVLAHSLASLVNMMAIDAGMALEKVVQFGTLRSGDDSVTRLHDMLNSSNELRQKFRERMEENFGKDTWNTFAGHEICKNFDIQALLVHDVDDEVTPLSDSQSIAAAWPGAELLTTHGLGHQGVLKDKSVVTKVVEFIQG